MSGSLKDLPSVDRLLKESAMQDCLQQHGHAQTTQAIRSQLDGIRQSILDSVEQEIPATDKIVAAVERQLNEQSAASLKAVINLTGTVLHTNLGRAILPPEALDAIRRVAGGNSNLEFDLDAGARGDRDSHIESLICELTGAEAVTVVNNNAAAVLISLNTFAFNREVCISRGELVEIGGSFRIPEVMSKSGSHLVEIGATNRTHLKDYEKAISANTALLMKVHTSNYEIRGFTKEVGYEELAGLARSRDLPLLVDLGSGTLVNLENYGLVHEPTVQDVLNQGADIVTFSGDKLLGGPQAGIIAGKKEYIDAIRSNPLKRALRVDKMTIAALHEVLKLYRHPETLTQALPTLRHLTRPLDEMLASAQVVADGLSAKLNDCDITITDTVSQIGSGALPLDQLPSHAVAITPRSGSDADLKKLNSAFRMLNIPVVGRMQDGSLLFDVRTLETPDDLLGQLDQLNYE